LKPFARTDTRVTCKRKQKFNHAVELSRRRNAGEHDCNWLITNYNGLKLRLIRNNSRFRMDAEKRNELIEKLAQIEVEMELIRKRMADEVDSLEKILNSVEELNALGRERDSVKNALKG
jgi:SMC interacting uncharacterized protein involved in chromosome segregation